MQCREARKKLADCNWQVGACGGDEELMAHLEKCTACRNLVSAERAISEDIKSVRDSKPEYELSFASVKTIAERKARSSNHEVFGYLENLVFGGKRFRLAVGSAIALFGFLAFVPFNFRERAGYEIAIAGVDKTIAEDNTEITSLFCALGMEEDKTITLHDSLDVKRIRLNVGECSETCYLTISDLKTEKDVAFVVKKIIELGCCQIDKIVPVFRNESSSLLKHMARKLMS
jgi:hypothetical protein